MTGLGVAVLLCGKHVPGIRRAAQEFWWSKERLVSDPFNFVHTAVEDAHEHVSEAFAATIVAAAQ